MSERSENINVVDEDPALLLVSGSKGDKQVDKEYVKRLSNAILEVYHKHNVVRLRCVGAAAVNNAEKAVAIAMTEANKKDIELVEKKSFTTVNFDGTQKTGLLTEVFER
tara:strand:- start:169 stop:495 length:327 start_codon:yes stop_codon:yes gene_type:complete